MSKRHLVAKEKMKRIRISEHELSGARITVPFTTLSRVGPKHHAIVVGVDDDKRLWIAELSRRFGCRLVDWSTWLRDNQRYMRHIDVEPNSGPRQNFEVTQSAVADVVAADGKTQRYHVLFNNCESFADRHQGSCNRLSAQVQKSARLLGVVAAAGAFALRWRLRQ